jgi:hypothetical protein
MTWAGMVIAWLRGYFRTLAYQMGTRITWYPRAELTPHRARNHKTALANAASLARGILTSRYMPAFMAALGALLTLSTLWQGLSSQDDLLHRAILLSASLPEAMADLFVFLAPERNRQLMELGALPWWTIETVRVAFFRPLAAFTHWVDYQLWPQSPLLMHTQSIAWYAGLCALAVLFYRQLITDRLTAGLAALLFTTHITHVSCMGALSSRNVFLTGLFGILTIWAHHRWRHDGWRPGVPLAILCLLLALLAAEAGVGTLAYLAAYAIFLEGGPWRRRLVSLIPYVGVAGIWRALYQHLGYGAWASGFYIDPVREPVRFLGAILERGPVLLLGQWVVPDPGAYAFLSTEARYAYWGLAILCMAFLARLLAPVLRRDRVARFWCLGMVLAVVPVCAVSLASGRHLIFVGIGATALMAQLLVALLGQPNTLSLPAPARRPILVASLVLAALQIVIYPVVSFGIQHNIDDLSGSPTDLGHLPGVEQQAIVVVNAPSPGQFIYTLAQREYRGQETPSQVRMLASAHSTIEITRLDTHTVTVKPEAGYLPDPGDPTALIGKVESPVHASFAYQYGDSFFRSAEFPMAIGQEIDLAGMDVEVTQLTTDGRPWRAEIEFDIPLEDASLRWLQWDWESNSYVSFTPPAIGETVLVYGPS